MHTPQPHHRDQTMSIVIAIIATAMGAIATLMMVVLLIAAMPNGLDHEIRWLRLALVCTLATGASGVLGSLVALIIGRPAVASAIGFAPTLVVVALIAWLLAIGL